MEIGRGSEHQCHLLAELNQMWEQVMELSSHLGQSSLSEFCKQLAPKLLLSVENLMSMAEKTSSDSPRVGKQSPRSDKSGMEFRKDMSKRRKMMPKWTSQMRLTAGADGGMDDGQSWRKYGQKVILGAKHPRGYFRCTHRYTRSCKATKQVQRTDEDPLTFDVTYHGSHTCLHKTRSTTARDEQAQAPKLQKANQEQQQLLQRFRTSIKVKTKGFVPEAIGHDGDTAVIFSFEASQARNGRADAMLYNAFCSPTTPDNCLVGAPRASLFSPTTTCDSGYLPPSSFRANSFGELCKLNFSELDAPCAAESPELDLSFLQLERLDLGLFDDDSCLFPYSRDATTSPDIV